MHESCSPKAFKWLSAPEKCYKESLCWSLLSSSHWQILSKIPPIHYWRRKVDTDQFVAFFVRFRGRPSAFVKQADSTPAHLPYICKPMKSTLLRETGNLQQSRLRCRGKLSALHQAKPRLWCSNYRYRKFAQQFTETIEHFWVVYSLSAAHSSFLV